MRASRQKRLENAWYEVSIGALAVGTAALALTAIAAAQTGGSPTLEKPNIEGANPTSPTLPSTGENLSERLGRSGGVIKPPEGVAPEMAVPPKEPGAGSNMPVIPPSQAPSNPPRPQ